MIKLTRRRDGPAIPAGFRGDKLRKRIGQLVVAYYEAQSASEDKIAFESAGWKPAKSALKKDVAGKCAYCEASTEVVAHGDVEHFRPKSVYWWLAYCFDNYLFSCQICNQTHKGDNFPISGRILSEPMPGKIPTGKALDDLVEHLCLDGSTLNDEHFAKLWRREKADLVNPYFEDPSGLFNYEVDQANEEIWMRSAGGPRADRAISASERYLGLNRESLRRERFGSFKILALCKEVVSSGNAASRELALAEVKTLQRSQQPFAGMHRWFAKQWNLPGP